MRCLRVFRAYPLEEPAAAAVVARARLRWLPLQRQRQRQVLRVRTSAPRGRSSRVERGVAALVRREGVVVLGGDGRLAAGARRDCTRVNKPNLGLFTIGLAILITLLVALTLLMISPGLFRFRR